MSDEIVSVFPKEQKETYFISPISKHNSNDNKSKHARGRLVTKFHTNLQRYREMTGMINDNRTQSNTNEVDTTKSLRKYSHNLIFNEH